MSELEKWKDQFNYVIYDVSEKVNVFLNQFILFVSIGALALAVYYTGFELPASQVLLIEQLMNLALGLFSVEFITRLVFKVHRRRFLRGHFWEAMLSIAILLELASSYLLGISLLHSITNWISGTSGDETYHIVKQLALFVLAISELIVQSQKVFNFSIKPASLFLLSFAGLSFLGALLLTLPEMTVAPGSMSFLDALFTATSATCVTGLIVVDTGSFFTLKGQVIILFLIQLGGIGIITFASFFTSFLRQGFGIKHQLAITDIFGSEDVKSSTSLLRQIIFFTLVFEAVGTLLIYVQLGNEPVEPFYNQPFSKLFYALFHAVSAFCNAGFSLFSNSLMHTTISNNFMLIMTFAILIIIGGIGFPVLKDLFSIKAIIKRWKVKWMKWEINSAVSIYTSISLILIGAVTFFFIEQPHTLQGSSIVEKLVHSFFQSVTTRTAGFNSLDIANLGIPAVIFFLLLMFIGGSSHSTAGGIKTSTFVVMMRSVISVIRNRPKAEIRKRTISRDLIYKAFAIFAFAVMFQFIGIFLLTITESNLEPMDIIFELVSAFNTVGLSRGITADLSETGKIVIITSMFVGRVGSLTLFFALSSPAKTTSYSYPEAHMVVG